MKEFYEKGSGRSDLRMSEMSGKTRGSIFCPMLNFQRVQ